MLKDTNYYSEIWERILKKIHKKFLELNDVRAFDSFLKDSKIYNIDKNIIQILVSSSLAKKVLSTGDYYVILTNIVIDELESNYELSFISIDETKKNPFIEEKTPLFKDSRLKPEMTFDNFVVGDSNSQAYEASLYACSTNKSRFKPNPLFLFSSSGLGKTHLLNSIGNAIVKNDYTKKVVITSGEEFFNEYFCAIRGERNEEQLFEYFKKIDVLLIDDIQFFIGKDKCQTAFFSIFSAFINNDKQVVITSDKHPNELKGIEERLVTRFAGGLTVSISQPEKSTSIEIIHRYIEASNIDITRFDDAVIEFFAEKFSHNVRELKGAINKLIFYTIINRIDHIDLMSAMAAVSDDIRASEKNKKLSENLIIEAVSTYYSLPFSQITGNLRSQQVALARHISMYLIRKLLNTPYKKIGEIFGGKDHSTVMSAVENVEKNVKSNPLVANAINEIKKTIKVPLNQLKITN